MTFVLPELPFGLNALEPYISKETLSFHYGKHHQGYVNKLNKLVEGTEFENETNLEVIIKKSSGGLFNNAAQVWNHTFYWNCLKPEGGEVPTGKLLEAIQKTFVSMEGLQKAFKEKATSNFGSGWTWLVVNKKGELEIVNTSNAINPMVEGLKPLLTCDVWEHAYYIDYRNNRAEYVDKFWMIVNWDFVAKNFG